ncbi:hypothetical protein TNCV_4819961 [Trichonephila clavipes]|nr:hypothetical protein TNCV_4819961 [Trichonephila clavipes]
MDRLYLRESDKRPLVSNRLESQRFLGVYELRWTSNQGGLNQQPHGGDRASQLTQSRCGITESELRTVDPLEHHIICI